MSLTKRALWIIERNLDRDLGLGKLAEACGVSPCHLSHAFAESTGRPITSYIRARRLSFAARALANGARDILDLGLASGYGSHEAFSRAFKTLMGVTPESVRRRGTTEGLPLAAAADITNTPGVALDRLEIRHLEARTYGCLSERFALAAIQDIPSLWRRFMVVSPNVRDKIDLVPVGMMWAIREDGTFDYGCAVQVKSSAKVPKELRKVVMPAQAYAVFVHAGHVAAIRGTYEAIWNSALSENGWTTLDEPCLEMHNPGFDPLTGEGGLTIWVPISEARQPATGDEGLS